MISIASEFMNTVHNGFNWFISQSWSPLLFKLLMLALAITLALIVFDKVFGKGSPFNCAVAAAVSLVLVYFGTILIKRFLPDLAAILPPLPFLDIQPDRMVLTDFIHEWNRDTFFPALLQLYLLSFIVNLLEGLIPDGKNYISWCLWRVLVVLTVLMPYAVLHLLITRYVPIFFGVLAAPLILFVIGFILLIGACKGFSLAFSTPLTPLMNELYNLFYMNPVWKHSSKAIVTESLILGGIALLCRDAMTVFVFGSWPLLLLLPFLILVSVGMFLLVRFL